MTPEQIAAVAARAAAATPGPWHAYYGGEPADVGTPQEHVATVKDVNKDGSASANALFIAHAREDIPLLLRELAEQSERIAALEGLLKRVAKLDDDGGVVIMVPPESVRAEIVAVLAAAALEEGEAKV